MLALRRGDAQWFRAPGSVVARLVPLAEPGRRGLRRDFCPASRLPRARDLHRPRSCRALPGPGERTRSAVASRLDTRPWVRERPAESAGDVRALRPEADCSPVSRVPPRRNTGGWSSRTWRRGPRAALFGTEKAVSPARWSSSGSTTPPPEHRPARRPRDLRRRNGRPALAQRLGKDAGRSIALFGSDSRGSTCYGPSDLWKRGWRGLFVPNSSADVSDGWCRRGASKARFPGAVGRGRSPVEPLGGCAWAGTCSAGPQGVRRQSVEESHRLVERGTVHADARSGRIRMTHRYAAEEDEWLGGRDDVGNRAVIHRPCHLRAAV